MKKTDWTGLPCAVLASGPSLTLDDIELIRQSGIKTVAVNTTWEKVRFADVIFAGDSIWWRYNHAAIDIPAERWSHSRSSEKLHNCKYRARQISPGYNSGASAVELAANVFHANPIILLGFDCSIKHGVHHHGEHKKTSNPNKDRANRWKPQFKTLKKKTDAEIINCSRYTEIEYFPIKDLRKTLCGLGLI